MCRIHFTNDDLQKTRLASGPDPMWETVLSLHALQSRGPDLSLAWWRRHTAGSLPRGPLAQLLELAPPLGYFPDFLTPAGLDQSLDDQLELLLGTPHRDLSTQIQILARPGPFRPAVRRTRWLGALERGDVAAMSSLGDSIRGYHHHSLEPYWLGIQGAIGADRARRAEQYAAGGLDVLLANLHPRVRWRPPVLEILDLHTQDVHLGGRGLLLQPSYFCSHAPTKLHDQGEHPVLIYPVERPVTGLVTAASDADTPAAALLGRTRASVLAATTNGCTTSDLARRCGIAVSTASQQATTLREGGLTSSRRVGGSVVHEITDLGLRLLAGPESNAAAANPRVPRPRRPVEL